MHRDLKALKTERTRHINRIHGLLASHRVVLPVRCESPERLTQVQRLALAHDRQCVIDSLAIPVVQFYLVSDATGDWRAYGARFDKVPFRQQTIYGYKRHLLITMGGVILDFELASANFLDIDVGYELLQEHTYLHVLGDKAYISAPKAAQLWRNNRLRLCTVPRRNQRQQIPVWMERVYNAGRQVIETVNSQLSEQFHIQIHHAHTFWGLCTRLISKLTAHTVCIYINRLLRKPDFLQIKALTFPF